MAESILQTYLNEQHIKTDVQENIDSLKKAVKEVEKYLSTKKTRPDIIPYTLVALDPKIKENDPVAQQVEAFIIKKWPAFKNSVTATMDKSTTYVRAVILESLSQLSKDDSATAALVWLTARDVIGYYHLSSEESVISGLLQGLADIVEENAQAAWGVSHKLQANNFDGSEISISAAKAAQIDEETLKQRLLDAMVHSGWNGNAGGGKNPQHQGVQDFNWPKFAAEHSAMGISEVVNSALTQQTKSFSTSINKDLTSSVTANNKRSELLWWKASLYSRLLNVSYRSLNPLNAAVCMSFDLAEEIDSIYPESVDYLLRETLKDVHGEQVEEERLLSDWLNDSSNLHENIKAALNKHVSSRDQRKPLLNSWATVVQSSENTDFFTETGIDKNAKLSASDLAVWLFHGLQAQKLVTNK